MIASEIEIAGFLRQVPAWTLHEGRLRREYKFRDFVQAFGFMTQVALLAERSNHHPGWSNSYSQVIVELVSHDEGGITERDFTLARAIEELDSSSG